MTNLNKEFFELLDSVVGVTTHRPEGKYHVVILERDALDMTTLRFYNELFCIECKKKFVSFQDFEEARIYYKDILPDGHIYSLRVVWDHKKLNIPLDQLKKVIQNIIKFDKDARS
jgi:hypothetical protein